MSKLLPVVGGTSPTELKIGGYKKKREYFRRKQQQLNKQIEHHCVRLLKPTPQSPNKSAQNRAELTQLTKLESSVYA